MHGCDALEGEVVVLHGEHAFLHFAAVPCVDDALFAACGVECYAGLAVEAEFLVVLYLCLAGIVDDEVGFELLEFLSCGLDEHVLHEVCLPCYFYDEAYCEACCFVGTAECVNDVEFLAGEFLDGDVLDLCPDLFAHGVVVVLVLFCCPPYFVLALCILHDVLVLGAASGVDAGHYVHCVEFGVLAFIEAGQTSLCLFLEEELIGGVVGNHGATGDAVLCQV